MKQISKQQQLIAELLRIKHYLTNQKQYNSMIIAIRLVSDTIDTLSHKEMNELLIHMEIGKFLRPFTNLIIFDQLELDTTSRKSFEVIQKTYNDYRTSVGSAGPFYGGGQF